jgi:hypothetical protein
METVTWEHGGRHIIHAYLRDPSDTLVRPAEDACGVQAGISVVHDKWVHLFFQL